MFIGSLCEVLEEIDIAFNKFEIDEKTPICILDLRQDLHRSAVMFLWQYFYFGPNRNRELAEKLYNSVMEQIRKEEREEFDGYQKAR